jgi:hypothetical protein
MQCQDVIAVVERQFVQGATVDELRVVVDDLRALSRESLLADFVEGRLLAIESSGSRSDDRRQFPPRDLCGDNRTGTPARQRNTSIQLH